MREILFRGKCMLSGDFVYGDLRQYDPIPCIVPIDQSLEYKYDYDEFEVHEDTIGQLLHTEKNSRQWFEGDICKINVYVKPYLDCDGDIINDGFEGYHVGVVCFDIKHGLCIKDYKTYCLESEELVGSGRFKTITLSRSEITGNIHDK